MFQEAQYSYLHQLQQKFDASGLETQLFDPDEEISSHVLLIRFPLVNRKYRSQFDLQLNFIPPEGAEEPNFLNLQFFSSLDEDLLPEQGQKLPKLILAINPVLPAGQFGLLNQDQELFFKHTALIHAQSDASNNIAILYAQMMLIVKVMTDFADMLLAVAYGKASINEALQASTYAEFLV
ncbi:MAG: hypothetical protein AAF821_05260 [Cyanobacteria bacterium P01_D01_bin.156]